MQKKKKRWVPAILVVGGISLFFPADQVQAIERTSDSLPTLVNVEELPENRCRFTYKLKTDKKIYRKKNHVYFAVPCGIIATGPGISQGKCGAGALNRDEIWAKGFSDKSVITAVTKSGEKFMPISIEVNSCKQGNIAYAVGSGKSLAVGSITGPILEASGEPSSVSTSSACHNLNQQGIDPGNGVKDKSIRASIEVTRGANSCINQMQAYTLPNCQGPGVNIKRGAKDPGFIFKGTFTPAVCNEIIIGKPGSPFYGYEFTSGGYTFRLCFDLANGQVVNWVPNCGPS